MCTMEKNVSRRSEIRLISVSAQHQMRIANERGGRGWEKKRVWDDGK